MRWWLVLLIPTVASQPIITGVVPDLPGPGGEGIALTSPTNWTLDGYSLTDGETVWRFPTDANLVAGEEAWAVSDISRWAEFDGPPPRWKMSLDLANAGDQVSLVGSEGVVDGMAYGPATTEWMVGSAPISGQALVLRRSLDSDSASDWQTPRTHRLGESNLGQPAFVAERVVAYSSPDNSFEVLTDLLASAQQRVALHVYELTAPALVDALSGAARRVPVNVLIEDHPVGLDASEKELRDAAIRKLISAGASVVEAGSVRYKYHHLKVLLVDDSVAVQSENWVEHGVPESPSWGNRGWGAVVESKAMADWFSDWMAADRLAWDSAPANPPPGRNPPRYPVPVGEYVPIAPLIIEGPVTVVPFISPDHTAYPERDPVVATIAGARKGILVQQLDLALEWTNRLGWSEPDVLIVELAAAAERGVSVRVMAAAPFRIDDTGNREAMTWLEARGVATREFHRDGIVSLHNKGLVLDGQTVVLGSMNGNHHSRSNNREVGLIIHSPAAADYFSELFEADWQPSSSRDWEVVSRDLAAIPATPLPMLLVAVAVVASRKCSR